LNAGFDLNQEPSRIRNCYIALGSMGPHLHLSTSILVVIILLLRDSVRESSQMHHIIFEDFERVSNLDKSCRSCEDAAITGSGDAEQSILSHSRALRFQQSRMFRPPPVLNSGRNININILSNIPFVDIIRAYRGIPVHEDSQVMHADRDTTRMNFQ